MLMILYLYLCLTHPLLQLVSIIAHPCGRLLKNESLSVLLFQLPPVLVITVSDPNSPSHLVTEVRAARYLGSSAQ